MFPIMLEENTTSTLASWLCLKRLLLRLTPRLNNHGSPWERM